jgi:hypothetical protein
MANRLQLCFLALSMSVFVAFDGFAAAPPTVTSLFPAGGQQGTTIEVVASGTFERWPVKCWSSDPSLKVETGKEKGTLRVTVPADAAPGVHWIRLFDDAGASSVRPFLVGLSPEQREVEPNDEPAKSQSISMPAVVNGKLAKTGDVDVFAVSLKKGQTLVASLTAHSTIRSPMDGILQLLDSNGTLLAQNHDAVGLDPRIAYPVPADGTYFVRLFAFPAQPDSSIRFFGSELCVYRLTLTTGPFLESFFPLAVETAKDATLTLSGWNLPAKPFSLSAKSERIELPDSVNFLAVKREPHPCVMAEAIRSALNSPVTVSGRLAPESVSRFALAGKKGQSLDIRLESTTLGSPLTPVLRIVDASKKQMLQAEPTQLNGDLVTVFSPPVDGDYTVEIRDLYRQHSPSLNYRCRIVPAIPDVQPTVATDRSTITVGKPLDLSVTLARTNGFKDEMAIEVEGLPEGVSLKPVEPKGKPDPKTVAVQLIATKAGFSGPIRLLAVSKSNAKLRKPVVHSLADFDATTTDLWLTTIPAPEPKKP